MARPVLDRLLAAAGLAVAYAALGRAGQAIAFQQVTAVFPASGVALAAILLWPRSWPGVWVGSFLLNAWYGAASGGMGATVLAPAAIATGAATEAVLGAWLVARFAAGARCLDRAEDAVKLVAFGSAASALSATVGSASMAVFRGEPFLVNWGTWWVGDVVGIILATPAVLAFATERLPLPGRRAAEAVLLFALLVAVALLGRTWGASEYMYLPCLSWAAFRLGQRGGAVAALVVAGLALRETLLGHGSFLRGTRTASLLELQTFLGIVAVSTLVLGAVLAERRRKSDELRRVMLALEEARTAAEEGSRAKSSFLDRMSHELRTPLNAIIGYSDMLPEESAEEAAADAKRIGESGRHLLSLLSDILEMAQVEAGTMEIRPSTFPLAPLLLEARPRAEAVAVKHGNRLEIEPPPEALAVRADREKLRIVIDNLLDNAGRFTSDGSVRVSATRHDDGGAPVVLLRVADTGVGIARDHQERIFEAFSQGDESKSRRHDGTGLGLALGRRLCRLMDGDLTVESAPGRGSTFTVRLPAGGGTS